MEKDSAGSSKSNMVTLKYCIRCLTGGAVGFATFLITIIAAKYLGYLVHSIQSFKIDGDDYTLALIGFAMFFLIKLLEPFSEKENETKKANF